MQRTDSRSMTGRKIEVSRVNLFCCDTKQFLAQDIRPRAERE